MGGDEFIGATPQNSGREGDFVLDVIVARIGFAVVNLYAVEVNALALARVPPGPENSGGGRLGRVAGYG